MSIDVAEHITINVTPHLAYQAVSDVSRMARWSPECRGSWVWQRHEDTARRFIGFNRRGAFIWFTTCRVVTAIPGVEFTFDVTTFGMPVARWQYTFAAAPGGTRVTEHWTDHRGKGARILGRIFTGTVANHRAEANRADMRTTLARLKIELEAS